MTSTNLVNCVWSEAWDLDFAERGTIVKMVMEGLHKRVKVEVGKFQIHLVQETQR